MFSSLLNLICSVRIGPKHILISRMAQEARGKLEGVLLAMLKIFSGQVAVWGDVIP